jgi:hypothetical protein
MSTSKGNGDMTPGQFAQLVALHHELPGVELKPPGPVSGKAPFVRVVRAMLGMVNREGGATVVIGVKEKAGKYTWDGMAAGDLATWTHDNVADHLVQYAEPPIEFTVETHRHKGIGFVVIEVREFDEIPVLCRKEYKVAINPGHPHSDYDSILRKGACYVRPRRKHETSEVASQEDVRDLIRLATDKGVRRWIAQQVKAGLIGGPHPGGGAKGSPSDRLRFDAEISDLR